MDKPSAATAQSSSGAANTSTPLRRFLSDLVEQGNAEALLGIIRSYVHKAGLASGQEAREIALELFQEMVVEALAHEERFDTTRPSQAWLLGIAAKLVMRRRDATCKRAQREPLIGECIPNQQELDDNQIFDMVVSAITPGPEQAVIAKDQVTLMLRLVSAEDRQVIELAVVYGLDGNTIAQQLNVKPNAARVRLHRALDRLRIAWIRYRDEHREGQHDE